MTAQDILSKLAQLKRDYETDCAVMRLSMSSHPGLMSAWLQIRGEEYDEAVIDVLAQAQRGVTKHQIFETIQEG